MKINNQEINIDDLFSQKYMHKEIKKGIYLSDYQISILRKNGIEPMNFSTINDIIYEIEDILETEDNDELEQISQELSEFNYYTNTNK